MYDVETIRIFHECEVLVENLSRGCQFGLKFYFICITNIITKQYNTNEIQTLYKWDSEGSQMTYLNLNSKHVKNAMVYANCEGYSLASRGSAE